MKALQGCGVFHVAGVHDKTQLSDTAFDETM